MTWISIVDELPIRALLVQVRYLVGHEPDIPVMTIGYRNFPPISDARIPLSEVPHVWYDRLQSDHKGRHRVLSRVTHWAPLELP